MNTEAKHTPAPWSLQILGQQEADLSHKGTFMGLSGGSGAPESLDEDDAAEWEANAHLISAAPDMLAALKLAEGRLSLLLRIFPEQHEECDHPTATGRVLGSVTAAIAKAVGAPVEAV